MRRLARGCRHAVHGRRWGCPRDGHGGLVWRVIPLTQEGASVMNRKLTYVSVLAFAGLASLAVPGAHVSGGNTGNGAPSGAHYNLNLIGKDHAMPQDNSGGSTIFCWEDGSSDIWLSPGDFAVLDDNATDDNGGAFQLPAPVSGSF